MDRRVEVRDVVSEQDFRDWRQIRLVTHAARLGVGVTSAGVEDPASPAFARRFGFAEVDRQIAQVRTGAGETPPTVPPKVAIVTVAQRPELLWPMTGWPDAPGCCRTSTTPASPRTP